MNTYRDQTQQAMSVAMSPRPGSLGGPPQMSAQQVQQPQQTGPPGIGMGRGASNTGLQNPGLNISNNANLTHPGLSSQQILQEDPHEAHLERLLNSYIYEHLLKSGFYQAARGLLSETSLQLGNLPQESSPNQENEHLPRRATTLKRTHSGIDNHPNSSPNDKTNGKSPGSGSNSPHNEPSDLPSADVPLTAPGQRGFLLSWWVVFWDVFAARSNQNATPSAYAYLDAQVYNLLQC
jgi:LisH